MQIKNISRNALSFGNDTYLGQILWVILLTSIFHIIYILWCLGLFIYVIPNLPEKEKCSQYTGTITIEKKSAVSFVKSYSNVFYSACREEVFCRFIPLILIQIFFVFLRDLKRVKETILWIAIFYTSAYFGFVHGNYINIFIQGFSGIFFCFIFLANGGYIIKDNSWFKSTGLAFFGLLCSTISHGVLNLLLIR